MAGQRAAYSSPNSPDEKNGPAASTDDCTAAATSPTLTKKNSVCCARDRSASRPPSQGSSETAGKGDAAASPASTTADKAMGDCKAEAEILVGLGKVPMNSSPSSSSPSPKKHFDTDPLADKTVESQTGSSDKPRSRDNGKERLADTCGELSPRESSYPSARRTAASESHSAEVDAMGSDLDRDGALTCQRQQEKQKQHLSFGSRAPVRTDAGPESHIGNTSNDHDDGDNTSLSGDSAATTTPRSGVIAAGLRVTVAASSSSEKSSSSKAPPGDSDVGFLPPTAGNETASRNSRALPPIVKTPGSPSASGETDSEHSDTVAPGAVGDRGTGGDAASCDAASGKKLSAERSVEGETKHGGGSSGGFRRNPGGSDSGYRRFHHSISEWERRSNHDEDTVGRRVRGGGGYMPPLVRLAAVAAAGGRSDGYGVHAGAGGVLHERYAYM